MKMVYHHEERLADVQWSVKGNLAAVLHHDIDGVLEFAHIYDWNRIIECIPIAAPHYPNPVNLLLFRERSVVAAAQESYPVFPAHKPFENLLEIHLCPAHIGIPDVSPIDDKDSVTHIES